MSFVQIIESTNSLNARESIVIDCDINISHLVMSAESRSLLLPQTWRKSSSSVGIINTQKAKVATEKDITE
jgi:hypothetical protein